MSFAKLFVDLLFDKKTKLVMEVNVLQTRLNAISENNRFA